MTLATVLGVFIVCWLPYIVYFTCMGLRRETKPPKPVHSVVLWLGYFNSSLNPILYPALNRDFRRAWMDICCAAGTHAKTLHPVKTVGKRQSVSSNEIHHANEYSRSPMEMHLNLEDINQGLGLVG